MHHKYKLNTTIFAMEQFLLSTFVLKMPQFSQHHSFSSSHICPPPPPIAVRNFPPILSLLLPREDGSLPKSQAASSANGVNNRIVSIYKKIGTIILNIIKSTRVFLM